MRWRCAADADTPLIDSLTQLRVNENDFETLRVLGRGGFGEVRLVRCKLNGQVYAMKALRKHKMRTEREVRQPSAKHAWPLHRRGR